MSTATSLAWDACAIIELIEKMLDKTCGKIAGCGSRGAIAAHNKALGETGISEDDVSLVYAYVDGNMHNFIWKTMNGQCSLKHTLDWSPERIDTMIVNDMGRIKSLIDTFGDTAVNVYAY